jgi:hypothetical protein
LPFVPIPISTHPTVQCTLGLGKGISAWATEIQT